MFFTTALFFSVFLGDAAFPETFPHHGYDKILKSAFFEHVNHRWITAENVCQRANID